MEPSDAIRRRGLEVARHFGAKLGLHDECDLSTLADAYAVTYEFSAPLMVRIADDMLADLRADVGSRRTDRVLALGRDGHSLAIAMRRLEPDFYQQHVSNLVVSRALVENALQDLEHHLKLQFPQVDGYRRVAPRVDPGDTVAGFRVLTEYLHAGRVPVDRPGSRVTVFDTSFKGTVQELLSAVYPETTFNGRYAFFGESPYDPHPGSKRGYEVHLSADETRQGRPFYELPADESKTFAHQLGINAVEELLDGPMATSIRIADGRPEQTGQRHRPEMLVGLSRGRISDRLRSLPVREGVKVVNLYAVADRARHAAVLRDTGKDYRTGLEHGAARFRQEIRAWIGGEAVEPRLKEFLDGFVHRADKQEAEALGQALDRSRVPEARAAAIWAAYDRCADGDKAVFVQNVLNAEQTGGGSDGRRTGRREPDGRVAGDRGDEREL
ncbi:hypothetical protein [Kribbella sp. NPDC051770]|uniref:hypothetical protein n=1 Tax=Kribbella sp. NPDC051770 TaxID=3155413 RepID=UPI00343CA8C7